MDFSLVLVGLLISLVSYLLGRAHGQARQRALSQPAVQVMSPAPAFPGLDDDRRAEISRLVAAGKKIEAIKVYRDATASGLKEARDAVERWSFEPLESGGQWPQLPGGSLR